MMDTHAALLNTDLYTVDVRQAREAARKARANTREAYTKLSDNSQRLERRIKENRFHITLKKALGTPEKRTKKTK